MMMIMIGYIAPSAPSAKTRRNDGYNVVPHAHQAQCYTVKGIPQFEYSTGWAGGYNYRASVLIWSGGTLNVMRHAIWKTASRRISGPIRSLSQQWLL